LWPLLRLPGFLTISLSSRYIPNKLFIEYAFSVDPRSLWIWVYVADPYSRNAFGETLLNNSIDFWVVFAIVAD
jgi:hypothetical protein